MGTIGLVSKGILSTTVAMITKGILGVGFGEKKFIQDRLVNLFKKNNTTTSAYDLSEGLSTRIKFVLGGRPNHGAHSTELPILYIWPEKYEAESLGIGETGKKRVDFVFDVWPVTQYGAGQIGGEAIAEDEATIISQNVHRLIRNKSNLSQTVSWVDNAITTFDEELGEESTYVKVNKTEVNCTRILN